MSDGEEDVFTLNGFMFCAEHGNELCNKCYADYRIGNNLGHLTDQQRTQIWKEIGKVSKGIGSLDVRSMSFLALMISNSRRRENR